MAIYFDTSSLILLIRGSVRLDSIVGHRLCYLSNSVTEMIRILEYDPSNRLAELGFEIVPSRIDSVDTELKLLRMPDGVISNDFLLLRQADTPLRGYITRHGRIKFFRF